jgi:hypothetical protein
VTAPGDADHPECAEIATQEPGRAAVTIRSFRREGVNEAAKRQPVMELEAGDVERQPYRSCDRPTAVVLDVFSHEPQGRHHAANSDKAPIPVKERAHVHRSVGLALTPEGLPDRLQVDRLIISAEISRVPGRKQLVAVISASSTRNERNGVRAGAHGMGISLPRLRCLEQVYRTRIRNATPGAGGSA